MDLEDINPWAVGLGLIGAGVTLFMMKFNAGNMEISWLWKILTPIVTFVVCFLLVQRMSDN